VLLLFHTHEPGPCHAHEHDVQLLVHVLPDAPSRVEAHQVGVEVPALFQLPDDPSAASGCRSEFVQVRRVTCQRSLLLSLGVVGTHDLETAARTLAAVAVLVDRHARQLGDQRLGHAARLRMVRCHGGQRTTITPDHEASVALFDLSQTA
jgi:hypothetical protein